MLVAGPNSTCDVCLEGFGVEDKAPCTISCGHVFCVDCIERVPRSTCPLCRTQFDPDATVKLHLDLDVVKPTSTPNTNTTPDDDDDARKLIDAMQHIALAGCTETVARQLIADGKAFLQKQPKDSFKELRTLYRMVSYLYQIKTEKRQLKQDNEAIAKEKSQLEKEKEELLKKIDQQLKVREEERAHALAIEVSLREHCSKAHEAYTSMVDQYNYVAREWTKLNEEIKRLRTLPAAEGVPRGSGSPSSSSHSPALELDQAQLQGAAVRGENSILISPLPQFTNRRGLDTTVSIFMPLPDVDEADEDEEESDEETESSEESEPEPSEKHIAEHPTKIPTSSKPDPSELGCGAASHPYSCACVGFSMYEEAPKERRPSAEAPKPLRPAIVYTQPQEPVKPVVNVVERPAAPPPSNLSRTAPSSSRYDSQDVRRARSYSNPSTSSSRTQSSSRNASRSSSPSPPVRSPPPTAFAAAFSAQNQVPQSPPSGDNLRNRLQDILYTGPSSTSSSPPKPSAMASAAVRDSRPASDEHYYSRTPSRSPSPPEPHHRNVHRSSSHVRRHSGNGSQSTTDQFSRLLASHQPVAGSAPAPSTSPNARGTSSASEAARALEMSKRERERADRHERRRSGGSSKSESMREVYEPEGERERERSTRPPTSSSNQAAPYQSQYQQPPALVPQSTLTSRPSTDSFNASSSRSRTSAPQPQYTQQSSVMSPYRYPTSTNSLKAHNSMSSLNHGAMYAS